MKRLFTFFLPALLLLMVSCKNNNEASSHNSMTVIAGKDSDEMQMPDYYDLETNRPVDVIQDSNTHQYVDVSTQKPLHYFYDAASHDTFDIRGRIINKAVINANGKYFIDRSKIKSGEDSFKIRTDKMKMKMAEKP